MPERFPCGAGFFVCEVELAGFALVGRGSLYDSGRFARNDVEDVTGTLKLCILHALSCQLCHEPLYHSPSTSRWDRSSSFSRRKLWNGAVKTAATSFASSLGRRSRAASGLGLRAEGGGALR